MKRSPGPRAHAARGALLLLLLASLAGGMVGSTGAAYNGRSGNAGAFATAALAAPGNVDAAVQSNGGSVQVTWSATASSWATGHRVYRATSSGGPYTEVAAYADRTTLSYSQAPGPGIYYYQVRAYYTGNGANWESQGNEVTGAIKTLHHFELAPVGVQIRGIPFNVTITAKASDGSTVTAFTGTVALTSTVGLTPATSGAFSGGVRTQSVTLSTLLPNLNVAIVATGGSPSCTGTSNAFLLV